jgi:hypothetical protein
MCIMRSNVPWLSCGMLQIGIREEGSVLSLMGQEPTRFHHKCVVAEFHCDEFGENCGNRVKP